MSLTRFLYFIFAAVLSIFSGSVHAQTEGNIYDEVAQQICTCINAQLDSVSEEVKNIFIDANGDSDVFQKGMEEFMSADEEKAALFMQDMEVIGRGMDNAKICFEDLDSKFNDPGDSQGEAMGKMLEAMKSKKDCAFVFSLITIGLQASASEGGEGSQQ